MARELVKTVRTVTRRSGAEGDAAQGKLRAALRHVARLTAPGYVEAVKKADLSDLSLHVFKKLGVGHMGKCGEYALHEVEPETIEANIMQAWGPGMYQLRPVLNNMYYPPSSVMFKISDGEEEPSATAAPGKDVEAVIAETTRNLGNLAVARKFKDLAKDAEGEGDVKEDRLVALLAAVKPDNSVLLAMMDAAEKRAERAEQRSQDMMRLLMEQRQGAQAGALPILGDLLKNVKPEVWQTLLNPAGPEPAGGWVDLIREVVTSVGPAIRDILPHVAPILIQNLRTAGVPVAPSRALADGSRQPTPPPAAAPGPDAGGVTMPAELTEEQVYSKQMILDFVRTNDMENAFAALAAFPGFAPGPSGPMPMGDFILSRVDPAVNPKVYIPQLLMLFPELKTMLPAAEAFVRYIQNKIVKDEEAALADERARTGAAEPTPTREDAQ